MIKEAKRKNEKGNEREEKGDEEDGRGKEDGRREARWVAEREKERITCYCVSCQPMEISLSYLVQLLTWPAHRPPEPTRGKGREREGSYTR